MSEQEFIELGPLVRRGVATEKTITIGYSTSYLSKIARLSIGNPIWASIAVTPSGRVRIKPINVPNENSAHIHAGGEMTRLAAYCGINGYKQKKYIAELIDGALYIQLERTTA